MSKVLITGGCGFVGWNNAKRMSEAGIEVICLDVKDPKQELLSWKNDNIKIIKGDVKDLQKLSSLIEREQITDIIHAGAIVGYSTRADEIKDYLRTNIEGTLNVLKAVRKHKLNRCIFISSEEVYGNFQQAEIDENHPVKPIGIYGISKAASEQLMELYHLEHGIRCFILRTIWVYGPGLPEERPPWYLINCAANGEKCYLENGADQFSDKTYIEDLNEAVFLSLKNNSKQFGVYNISSGKATYLNEMIELIKKIIPDADIGAGPGNLKNSKKVDMPAKGTLNIEKAKTELGFNPEYDLEKGLKKYIDWLRSLN